MEHCCDHKSEELSKLNREQALVLWVVLVINLIMFFVEMFYGLKEGSSSLMADSLDMLGDASIYGLSIYAIYKSMRWKAGISLIKGLTMGVFGAVVLGQTVWRFFQDSIPQGRVISSIAGIALVANLICALLLLRYKNSDINMRSTWLCSRNDAISNFIVVIAGFLVTYFQSNLPDLILGGILSVLVLSSSFSITRESIGLLKK